ncbi:MAG: type III pantothenate kinase [Cyclobacteriaceae bacterium]|nr:type III pantothenate kinase [Cyclobacteriaceae bacterium]
MNLVIDSGNTRIKAALFNQAGLVLKENFSNHSDLKFFLNNQHYDHLLVSSVSIPATDIASAANNSGKKIILNPQLALPIKLNYTTPNTLGVDRIAAACGAYEIFPHQNCLVIDAGTCINTEFIDASGTYRGGSISPGITMRFKAMHTFTQSLPLLNAETNAPLTGNSTETCMQSGVLNGALAEVDGLIKKYQQQHENLRVILCGGDYAFFENNLKHAIFVAPDLVLTGLNRILRYHAEF